jgi:hypothetical protein
VLKRLNNTFSRGCCRRQCGDGQEHRVGPVLQFQRCRSKGAALYESEQGAPKADMARCAAKNSKSSLLPHMAMLPSGARRPNSIQRIQHQQPPPRRAPHRTARAAPLSQSLRSLMLFCETAYRKLGQPPVFWVGIELAVRLVSTLSHPRDPQNVPHMSRELQV